MGRLIPPGPVASDGSRGKHGVVAIMMGPGDTFPLGLLGRSHHCAVTRSKLQVDALPSWIPGKFWLRYSHSMKTSLLSAESLVPVIDL